MSWNAAELAGLILGTAASLVGWWPSRWGRLLAGATLLLLAAALGIAAFGRPDRSDALVDGVLVLSGVYAVAGGGPLTTQVFALVDRQSHLPSSHPRAPRMRQAGEVLRGGAWMGGLERLAVFAAVVAGWGPGVAVVLAVKGLGRYPELRNQEDTGVAERFIIGTFTSVLWAVGCAGIATFTS